ncbi:GNAT family N-acetyltransferase [Methylogaea oryzae]|uniref:N-acetyltransferase n=1 Tax=Methylogaea oryzae TaxID=1295382 RepID=A0A8D4VQS1_9GAMM|nr:GNAT family N-acetyltransferase [Methylogaea oryzae]BBL72066.1 N-acetyltransferase [Methylogaea oryzae]
MSHSLLVRPAQARHVPALLELLDALFRLESDFAFDAGKAERGLRMLLGQDDALALAAEARGRVVGLCTVQTVISTAEGGPVGWVEDVVVAEDWRGRGVGRRLLAEAERWAAERGLTRLQLLADGDNRAALDFYDRLGWGATRLVCRRRTL